MNELDMTKRDYEKRIKKEKKYLVKCEMEILDIKSRIRATKRSISWLKQELKKISKKEG